jgi:hypothetical protein
MIRKSSTLLNKAMKREDVFEETLPRSRWHPAYRHHRRPGYVRRVEFLVHKQLRETAAQLM